MRADRDHLCLSDELGGTIARDDRRGLGLFVETEAAIQEEVMPARASRRCDTG